MINQYHYTILLNIKTRLMILTLESGLLYSYRFRSDTGRIKKNKSHNLSQIEKRQRVLLEVVSL